MIAQSTLQQRHLHMTTTTTRACFSRSSQRRFIVFFSAKTLTFPLRIRKHLNMNPPCDLSSGLHKQQLSIEVL